ncbi:MAG: hypothetical protein WBD27_04105 [Pyrinomonadaceae bacterium]
MAENKTNLTENLWLILLAPIVLLIAFLGLVFVAVSFPFVKTYEQWLMYRFWQRHGQFGRFILFVYSDSPNWKNYIEENILPRIGPYAITLNWSKRREWRETNPFEARVFYHWAGKRQFNPMAILLSSEGKMKEIRFWQAFKDFKHGKDKLLKEAEESLFNEVKNSEAQPVR